MAIGHPSTIAERYAHQPLGTLRFGCLSTCVTTAMHSGANTHTEGHLIRCKQASRPLLVMRATRRKVMRIPSTLTYLRSTESSTHLVAPLAELVVSDHIMERNRNRLVVNMRAPNKAIKREYFPLPLMNDMKVKLHGAKFFSKLDLTSAYYHLELCKESRDLTTFLTENGMYRFTRLMFGVNCAPEIFQREMTRILKDFDNIIVYIDDILIFAATLEELRSTVARVMQVLRANNLTLNVEKCELDKTSINFLGHRLDENGFHIEDAKIKSIRQFRHPQTVSELRSFLGLASFVSPYIQDFANLTSPLWSIVTAKAWSWGVQQNAAFETLKDRIANSTISLGYFSESDKTYLYTDASPNALGAVLVQVSKEQKTRVISFASKALTLTERRYAQNQREALSTVWAVEHFSYFLLGRHFTLRTDAKGVAFILDRSRENSKRALTRADGWALRLSPYSYDVEYVKGRENIADPSSRLYEGTDQRWHTPQSAK